MRDLLVVTPSRGRPGRLGGMLDAALSLSEAHTDIAVGLDHDDPARDAYRAMEHPGNVTFWWRDRDTVSGWTNHLAIRHLGQYRAFASMSDDHMARTPGWDRLLLEAIGAMGGTGIAYGDDLLQGPLVPTAAVVSAGIVAALGWLALPQCRHFWIDNAWKALGEGAGCLAYLPGVVIEHLHPGAGKGAWDETYASEAAQDGADKPAYDAWLGGRMHADVAVIRRLREQEAPRADVR